MNRLVKISLFCGLVVWFIVLAGVAVVNADNYYVRPNGGSYGNEDGSDWNNAFDGMPADGSGKWGIGAGKIGPGDTVYIAGGTYNTTWEIGESGTSGNRIVIKRATASDHGTDTGWSSSFDSQAYLDDVAIIIYGDAGINSEGYEYITIDGQIPSGIKIKRDSEAKGITLTGGGGYASDYITLRYIEVEGEGLNQGYTACNARAFQASATRAGQDCDHLLVEYCEFHHFSGALVKLNGVHYSIFQYNIIHDTQDTNCHEDWVITYDCSNLIFRYNIFYNTESLGFQFETGTSDCDVHNNIMYGTGSFKDVSDMIKDDGGTNETNINIYNNTFIDARIPITFRNAGDTGNVKNNLFYSCRSNPIYSTNITHDYNWYSGSDKEGETNGIAGGAEDPFVNYAGANFHPQDTSTLIDAGVELPSEFSKDIDGILRPQGAAWDIGAYELEKAPSAPSNLHIVPGQ